MGPAQPSGLYVHVPFCRTKCPYCAFESITDMTLIEKWLAALKREAEGFSSGFGVFDTLYLGGGTPSVLPDDVLGRLMGVLLGAFRFTRDLEATIEVNPGDVGGGRASTLYGLGFSRASVGVQSFIQPELEFLGRRHNAARAVRSVGDLKEAGFTNVGLDLIQGMPGQTGKARLESLQRALELEPQHLSCYELTIEDGTPFGRVHSEGRLSLPSEDDAADGFRAASLFLTERGFVHYEVSNFAFGEVNRSRHNRKYWTHAPYLGLGPAAHSFDGKRRWWNVPGVGEYIRTMESTGDAKGGTETLSESQFRLERMALGFRNTNGVEREDLGDGAGSASLLERVIEEGLVEVRDGRVVPTIDGMRVADGLARGFMNS